MQRITELAKDYLEGRISAKTFRSALIAQLSMLDDVSIYELARLVHDQSPRS